jgi:hypothetical protein
VTPPAVRRPPTTSTTGPSGPSTPNATKTFLGQLGKTRTTERARLQADYDRALRVITNIETATGTSATEEHP